MLVLAPMACAPTCGLRPHLRLNTQAVYREGGCGGAVSVTKLAALNVLRKSAAKKGIGN